MKNYFVLSFLFCSISLFGQRQEIPFSQNWQFEGATASGMSYKKSIDLPHTWNDKDVQAGITQHRSIGVYTKSFPARADWAEKRVFIHFEGANITSKVILNGQEVGMHKGGYAAFAFELTPYLDFGRENELEVEVSNELDMAVIPLVGDFNNYGGIYRPLRLIITEKSICISPLDYASPGVYIKQSNVSSQSAQIEVITKYLSKDKAEVEYKTTLVAADGSIVASQSTSEAILLDKSGSLSHTYSLENPHLWNGRKDPYMYQVRVELIQNGNIKDSKTENFGLRYFDIDANEGFSLNGQPMPLRGVSRHQDKMDKGSALSDKDQEEDMEMMLEMGINTLRLAHYQHAEKVYDLTDSAGLVVWAEIPFIGLPDIASGQGTNGYEGTDDFHNNVKQQLIELIRQNYNHPSIVMWSLYNELQNPEDASPIEFLKELNVLAKSEDPDRLTVAAGMLKPDDHPEMQSITDVFAFNRYFGWYYGEPGDLAGFLDETHKQFPTQKLGISEYGAGGSIYQHSDKLKRPNPFGAPHPEEWQSYYHEEHLKILDERPFVWGSFVWNMFDFSSHRRREGDQPGRNDKGLVTFDRKTKKDAFYYYKANWSEEPVLYITSRRYVFRKEKTVDIKVYSNFPEVSLVVNGREYATKTPEKGIAIWEDVQLEEGANGILVQAVKDGETYADEVTWMYEHPFKGTNLIIRIFDWLPNARYWIGGGFLLVFLTWWKGIRRSRHRPVWQKGLIWTVFILLLFVTLGMFAANLFLSNMLGG